MTALPSTSRATRLGLLATTMALLVTSAAASAAPVQADWRKIKIPALRKFVPQQPTRIQLDNGLVIFLQPDTELPLIEVSLTMHGGAREEPADQVGLVSLFSQVWRSGGTRSHSGDQIDDLLGLRAAKVEASADADSIELGAVCLKNDFDEVFKLVVEMLREPEFQKEKLELAKKQLFTSIARRNDNPMGIAARESSKLALGARHPYARHPEYASVNTVRREDLLLWHKRYVHPGNLLLGVSGDFDAAQMEAKLRQLLSSWPKGQTVAPVDLAFNPTKPGVYLVAKDDVNQSNVHLVQLGTTRKNPDAYALEVMNEVLGGGFAARLFSNVRSKKGLAYAVRGGVGLGWDVPSLYRLFVGTESKNTEKAIQALYEEINGMTKNPPTAAEVQKAKDAILNSFVFKFDTKAKILQDRMRLEFYGYPADYNEKYPEQITKVTLDDVNRVAKKYLNPSGFAVLVVGNPQEFGAPLTGFGPVTTLDVTIPPPPVAKPAAPAPH
jgi:zinc protease